MGYGSSREIFAQVKFFDKKQASNVYIQSKSFLLVCATHSWVKTIIQPKHNVLNLRQKYTVLDDFSVAKHDPEARILRLLARLLYQYKHIGMFLHENAFSNSRV